MADDFKAGDKMSCSSHGGTATGMVARTPTRATTIKGRKVAASAGNPEYLVETDAGERAAHQPGALRKR